MSAAPLLVGLDAGTRSIRALVFEPDGTVVAEGGAPTPTVYAEPARAHYEPEALWRAAARALRQATGRIHDPRRIVGIAAASIGESAVPLDADGAPTHNAIAWFDQRTKGERDRLERTVGGDQLFAVTGLNSEPIFGLCKLLWLKANERSAFERTRRWLNIADYLAWRMCGVAATDYSLASRTLALDIHALAWAEDLIREAGVSPNLFAPLRPSGSPLAPVTPEAARATGLPRSCVVGVGGHDHICGALAAGAWQEGVVVDSLGTAEALLLALDKPIADAALGRGGYSQGVIVVDQPAYYVVGGLLTSGGSIEWFRDILGGAKVSYAALIAEGEAVPPGSLGVCFLPHLRAGSPPHPDPRARGAFFGLSTDATRGTLFRAILEGLAYDARLLLEGLSELPGVPPIGRIRAIGGHTRNELLMRIKAAVFNRAITVAEMPETTSLGAAIFGGLAAGVYSDLAQALAELRSATRCVEPAADLAAAYDARFRAVYRRAYKSLRPLHRAALRLDHPD